MWAKRNKYSKETFSYINASVKEPSVKESLKCLLKLGRGVEPLISMGRGGGPGVGAAMEETAVSSLCFCDCKRFILSSS